MQYKVNTAIRVRYLAVNYEEGLTDLKLTATSPSGIDQSPVTLTEIGDGLYEALFTPDSVGWWSVRISSILAPQNIYGLTYYVGTTDNPYPAQQDELNNKIGEVQASPTQYTVLARLKDIWDKLNDLFTNGTGKVKIWDGTNQAGIDSQNHLYVSGKSATGTPPSTNPVYVSGIDADGKKRGFLTDSNGKLYVVASTASSINKNIQLLYDKTHTAVNTSEWQEALTYTVPASYNFNSISFEASSAFANEGARAIIDIVGGYFNCSTNTFTDGVLFTSPEFATRMYVYVTTQIGSGANDAISITYTNQDGTTGRTASITIPKNSLVGTRLEVTLQTGDYGILDITNCTHTQTGQAGAFDIELVKEIFYLTLTTAKTQYQAGIVGLGGVVISAGVKISLQYLSATATAQIRRISLIGTLIGT